MILTSAATDLGQTSLDVKEARARIERLTAEIEIAQQRGQSTQVAEEILVTMLVALEQMLRREEATRKASAPGSP